MEFEERLQKAISRGQRRSAARADEAREQAMTAEELKRAHSQYRLELSEHIEQCIKKLANHFPGFRFETVFGDRGWGAACSRDDLRVQAGRRENSYSRLEVSIRPFSESHVVDLAAKGTIRNKEAFNRNYFEQIEDADVSKFLELIDIWVLEYAELYASWQLKD